ncbi:MAG: acetylglucosaminyldiphospho-UDP acetyl-beta-D-mannosaminyltransferase [Desulfobacterales bacterium]|nr:MAG: acetylglucosaminyldiphospho-UDP acetyl-beta-D-mannosaminyltransferase [Desulfobacterales bacterium]
MLPDGIGIVLASRLAGGGIRKRITGMDLFLSLNRELARIGGRIFLLGTTNKNLAAICEKLSREFPGLQIAGYYAPPFAESFTDEEENHMVKQINAAAPDILWIGLGSPKQEIWARRNLRRLDTCLIAPVGAVFDFYTGRIMRPAPLFQRTGLEWLIRLMGHPPRLYERTLISAPWFLARVIGDRPWRRKCGRRENAE